MAAKGDGVFEIAAAIVTVALVTTIVSAPETARIIGSIGGAFSEALKTAMGKGSFR
ncbi:MAG: hypothetical protein M3O70_09185 [Actinomycetota bacterium]|nr:hypothetical protein [Actinomycetota bacterium]